MNDIDKRLHDEFGAVKVSAVHGEEGQGGGVAHVVAVVDFSPQETRSARVHRTGHPYIGHLPVRLQRHFNARKMEMDVKEMPYHKDQHTWTDRSAPLPREVTAEVSAICATLTDATCYAYPITLAPHHAGNDGLLRLGRLLHVKLSAFILATGESHVCLSFIGRGIGGLIVRASLSGFDSDTSVLNLSGISVEFGSFVTIGTPHLGVRRSPELGNVWKWLRDYNVVRRYGLVGRELLMEDADFALMDVSLHDSANVSVLSRFRRRVYVAVRHDTFASEATALQLADMRMTPLGKYVKMCDRGEEPLPVDPLPDVTPPTPTEDPAHWEWRWHGAAWLRYWLLETMFGPPALLLVLFALFYSFVTVEVTFLGIEWVAVLNVVLSLLSLATCLASGYTFNAGYPEVPVEERFQHLGNPLSRATFFKTSCRIFNTCITDPASEVSVNQVKEVLNFPDESTIERIVVSPAVYTRTLLPAHSAITSPLLLSRAVQMLELSSLG